MARIINRPSSELCALSDRERLVAEKFASGMTYREIGNALFIAPSTVRTHLATIYSKLGVRNKVSLVSYLSRKSRTAYDVDVGTPPAGPTLAVLPIESLNVEDRWRRFADGLTSDLIVDLARFADLPVIAFHTMKSLSERSGSIEQATKVLGVAYILSGRLLTDGQQMRLTVQLSDAISGVSLWSERYDRNIGEIFALQDGLIESVINALAGSFGRLAVLGRNAVHRKTPANLGAYDNYLLGVEQHNRFSAEGNAAAIRYLLRAIQLDPTLARAWTELGYAYAVEACNGFSADVEESIRNWRLSIEKALSLDAMDCFANACLGDVRACYGDLEGALEAHDNAYRYGAHHADTLVLLAGSKALISGDPFEALSLMERGLKLNPLPPAWYLGMKGRILFVVGRYSDSISALLKSSRESPNTLMFLAIAHAAVGETVEAMSIASRLRAEHPMFSVDRFIRSYPITSPHAVSAIRNAAGLVRLN